MKLPCIRDVVPGERVRLVCLIGQLTFGGSERQLYLALKYIDPERFERHVVVFNASPDEEYVDALQRLGVTVWRVPSACRGVIRRVLYLARLFASIKPHVVHSWSVHDNPYAGVLGLLARAPVIMGSVRGSWSSAGLERLSRLSRFACLYAVPTLLVNSRSIASELISHGVSSSKVVTIRNALEIEPQPEESRESVLADLGMGGGERYALIVGNLREVKNHRLFIDAMFSVAKRFPEVRGVIIGRPLGIDPGLLGSLQRRVLELGLQEVIKFVGFRADVQRFLPHASLVCLTSNQEGMPNVILEAMAAGRPVVATRVGGLPEVVKDRVSGLLINPGDVQGLSEAMLRVLEDPLFASRLGATAKRSVERRFGGPRVASRLTAMYLDGLHSHLGGAQHGS